MESRRFFTASVLALGLGLAASGPVMAQSQPGDPPGLVGRLAEVSGNVSFHTADANQWQAATLNYPVTSGNAFWTEPRSHAAIDVGAARIYLDSSTELDFATVADQSVVATLAQGAIYLRLAAADGNQYEIDTPRGAIHIAGPGSYEIVAGDNDHPTAVTAFDGTAQIVGPEVNAAAGPQQTVDISGQNPAQVSVNQAASDDFVRFVQLEDQPYQNAGPAPQYVSPDMTGYQDLNRYGQWQQTPDYGAVWMPQVSAGWAPYRDGRWAYVAPWGWTWIDDAPWGFAPFHYGRWVQVSNRWGWTPGSFAGQPVYAPALVSFFGGFDLGGIGISVGFGPAVGWVPLGPNEVYVPPYRSSQRYIRNVNITNVHNETTIINVVNNKTVINNYNNYRNHNGATIVQADAMTGSRPIGPAYNKLTPDQRNQFDKHWSQSNVAGNNPPVKPTWKTAGVTPRLAQQLDLQPPADGQSNNRPAAPGPNGGDKSQGPAQVTGIPGPAAQPLAQPNGQLHAPAKGPFKPQGQGPAFSGGANTKLPPLLANQKPKDNNRFVNGQIPSSTQLKTGSLPVGNQPNAQPFGQTGSQNLAATPQWQKNAPNGNGKQTTATLPAPNQQWKPQKNGQSGSQNLAATPQWQKNAPNGNGKQTTAVQPQFQPAKPQKNGQAGNQGWASTQQWQPQANQHNGGAQKQKVEQKQPNGKGPVPLYNNTSSQHKS
jgi:hypothetical protein